MKNNITSDITSKKGTIVTKQSIFDFFITPPNVQNQNIYQDIEHDNIFTAINQDIKNILKKME